MKPASANLINIMKILVGITTSLQSGETVYLYVYLSIAKLRTQKRDFLENEAIRSYGLYSRPI